MGLTCSVMFENRTKCQSIVISVYVRGVNLNRLKQLGKSGRY